MGNTVRITAQLDDKVSGPLAKIRDQFDRLGSSKGAQSILSGVGIGAGITAFGLVEDAVHRTVDAFGELVKAGLEGEASQARLNASLKANVPAFDGNTEAINANVEAQAQLGFGAVETRDSLALLVAATHDVNKAFDVLHVAEDLARFKQISLGEATQALTRVEGGSYRILKSLGIQLKANATQQDALTAVEKVASDQAEAYANTVEGKLTVAQTKFGNAMEDLGTRVLPLVTNAIDGLNTAMDALGARADSFDGFVHSLTASTPHIDQSKSAVQGLADALTAYAMSLPQATRDTDKLEGISAATQTVLDGLTGKIKDSGDAAQKTAGQYRTLASRVDDATQAFLDSIGGIDAQKRAFDEAKDSLKDDQKALHDLQAIKDPTRAQREDINKTKDAIDDDKRSAALAAIKLEQMGGISYAQLVSRLAAVGVKLSDDTDLARALRHQLYAVQTAYGGKGSQSSGPGGVGLASGGYVPPGWTGAVGEEGPETLMTFPGGGGFVIPNSSGGGGGSGSSGGGSPVVISLQLDGRQVARVVDRHLYYEAARAPGSPYTG